MKTRAVWWALAGAAALASAPAGAAVVVDQSALVIPDDLTAGAVAALIGFSLPPSGPYSTGVMQSVTAGTAGYLDHLDVQLFSYLAPPQKAGTVTLKLFDGDLAAGSGNLVGTATLAATSLPERGSPLPTSYASFDVRGANFLLTPGQRFSITLDYRPVEGSDVIAFIFGSTKFDMDVGAIQLFNDYAGGELRGTASTFAGFSTPYPGDLGFRTFVDTVDAVAVPEPASWAMMIAGFGAVGGAMRRRPVRVLQAA